MAFSRIAFSMAKFKLLRNRRGEVSISEVHTASSKFSALSPNLSKNTFGLGCFNTSGFDAATSDHTRFTYPWYAKGRPERDGVCAYREGSIYQAIGPQQIFIIALTILLTGILLMGAATPRKAWGCQCRF
jgi:hypothetical protein